MSKKKVLSKGELNEIVCQSSNDISGGATKLLGFDRVMVKCQDGREPLCDIHSDIGRPVCVRVGGVVLVSPLTLSQIDEETCFDVAPAFQLEICLEKTALPSAGFRVESDGY
ncbi:MAG TPA: hypothetical protein VEH86_04190 [Candidatus Acidoferrum sp.]|nr:hypothetical protein [Candidatus Acidoferrum sp.]